MHEMGTPTDNLDERLDQAEAGASLPPPPPRGSRRRAWSTGTVQRRPLHPPHHEAMAELDGQLEAVRIVPDEREDFATQPPPPPETDQNVAPTECFPENGRGGGNGNGSTPNSSGGKSKMRRPRSSLTVNRIGIRPRLGSKEKQDSGGNGGGGSGGGSGGSGTNRTVKTGRIRRSVSARTLINLRGFGGIEAVDTDDVDSMTNEPIVDLREIARDASEDNLADVAQSAAARQALEGGEGGGGSSAEQQQPLVRQLLSYFRNRPCRKKVLMLTVIGSVIWVCVDFATTEYIRTGLGVFMSWMQENAAGGFFAFIGLFIVTTLIFVPPSILTLGSGVAFAKAFGLGWGIFLGSAASFFGSCVGAVIAFFRARYLMRDLIKLFAERYPIVHACDLAIKHKGFRIYVLLRMCPIIPFNALNYIGGITGVKWTHYTAALIGILPWQITLVFIGATVGSVNNLRDPEQRGYSIVSITLGCVFSVFSLVIMWYYARKELKKEIAAHQPIDGPNDDNSERRSSVVSEESFRSSVRSTLGDGIASFRERAASFSSLPVLASNQGESDRSVRESEDTEWFWIWT